MPSLTSRAGAYLLIAFSVVLGSASMLAFVGFLWFGSPNLIDLGLGRSGAMLLNAALCLAFFVQHSGMIRRAFRTRLQRVVHEPYVGAVFTIASAIPLLTLVCFWQGQSEPLLHLPMWARTLLRVIFVASALGGVWGLMAIRALDAFGIEQIRDHLEGSKTPPLPFAVRGPYRWVRHPLYFFFLVMIWACPDPTLDRLLLNGLWTVWVILGTILEERDLRATFGEPYRDYQRRVPMLIPWRLRPATPTPSRPGP